MTDRERFFEHVSEDQLYAQSVNGRLQQALNEIALLKRELTEETDAHTATDEKLANLRTAAERACEEVDDAGEVGSAALVALEIAIEESKK